MTGDRSRSELLRMTLPNGLRVLLATVVRNAAVAVTVHYGVDSGSSHRAGKGSRTSSNT